MIGTIHCPNNTTICGKQLERMFPTTQSQYPDPSHQSNREICANCIRSGTRPKKAFAAAVYLRRIDQYYLIHCSLLMARQRLALLKEKGGQLTIPRLELLALLIGTRLANFILMEMSPQVHKIRVYSDSQAARIQSGTKMVHLSTTDVGKSKRISKNGKLRSFW